MTLEVGMKNSVTITVTDAMCADVLDSQLPKVDLPHVFSTPNMINLMELTCADMIARGIESGLGSVGMAVEVKHIAATPAGKQVTCQAELIETDGRKLLFKVEAFDDNGKIGFGTHRRAIIKKK